MKHIPVRRIKENSIVELGKFNIRSISDLLKGADLTHELHRHDFYFILAVDKGSGIHEIDFIEYEVCDNTIFMLRPGQVHRLELKVSTSGFLIEFDTKFYQPSNAVTIQRFKKATSKNQCQFQKQRFDKLLDIVRNVYSEYTDKGLGYSEAIKANLDLFFIEFIRQSVAPVNKASGTATYTQDRFEEFLSLLEVNITKVKTVSEYADMLSLSGYQLNSITKASVGKTASELINEQIILEAKRHLLATLNQVKDIAFQIGFEDISYFIRLFKKQTGLTPEAFRQNFK